MLTTGQGQSDALHEVGSDITLHLWDFEVDQASKKQLCGVYGCFVGKSVRFIDPF